jgi:DNA-binding SARP family transcriptional activator
LNPLQEEIHREMMRLYLENGQRALAVRQYQICCSILAKELGIAPMEETKALSTQILNQPGRDALNPPPQESTGVDQALRQLKEASQTVELAKVQIQQALQAIARYSQRPE